VSADVAKLFEDFDRSADEVIDNLHIAEDSDGTTALAAGLAIRLVQWVMADALGPDDAMKVAHSLLVELTALRQNIVHNVTIVKDDLQ
jgi:hypothetical protein